MKKLDKISSQIFCSLIDKMEGKQHLKLLNEPYMPLVIERLETGIITPYGTGTIYSLAHYYMQNGDSMQDPEMCFIVVDNRNSIPGEFDEVVFIFPSMFQQANLSIYQEGIVIINNAIFDYYVELQADHAYFANEWLVNIQNQDFLNV